jgi:hydroxybutyrate-dimer hydrolase
MRYCVPIAPTILPTDLQPFAAASADADRITVNGNTVEVPN